MFCEYIVFVTSECLDRFIHIWRVKFQSYFNRGFIGVSNINSQYFPLVRFYNLANLTKSIMVQVFFKL